MAACNAQEDGVLEQVKYGRVTEDTLAAKLTTFVDQMDNDQGDLGLTLCANVVRVYMKGRREGWLDGTSLSTEQRVYSFLVATQFSHHL